MGDLAGLFDALYGRFLLRDVLGKVIPGLIVMAAVAVLLGPPLSDFQAYNQLLNIGFWPGAALVGVAWLFGFAVQYLWNRDDRAFDAVYKDQLKLYLSKVSNAVVQAIYERSLVLPEACRNGSWALRIAAGLGFVKVLLNASCSQLTMPAAGRLTAAAVIIFLVGLFLGRMANILEAREEQFRKAAVSALKELESARS